jgi:large subunit ribosomal protein L9
MQVILVQDVPKIGKTGEIKEVASGYGVNFLLPKGLAEIATPGARKRAEALRAKRAAEEADVTRVLQLQANALRDRSVVIRTKAEEGRLFGSVGADEIAAALSADGVEIDPKQIRVEKPFKMVGQYDVVAEFGHGITAEFEVKVMAA